MSRQNMWQICHKKWFNNKQFTEEIVEMLRAKGIKVSLVVDALRKLGQRGAKDKKAGAE